VDETRAAEYRPLLFSIAYGMTGSVGDAEDIVQDAFLGLTRARQAGTEVADPKAYLATAVTRLGINYLRSARAQRETYVGDWLPEPVVVVDAGDPSASEAMGTVLAFARPVGLVLVDDEAGVGPGGQSVLARWGPFADLVAAVEAAERAREPETGRA